MGRPTVIRLRSNEELAAVASDGIWGHPVTLALMVATTGLYSMRPQAVVVLALVMTVLTLVRVHAVRFMIRQNNAAGRDWRRRLLSSLMASGIFWGIFAAWSVAVFGYHSETSMTLLIYHAAIAVFGAASFVDSARLTRLYIGAMVVPPFLAYALFPDGPITGPLVMFAFYTLFLCMRMNKQQAEFQRRYLAEERYELAVQGNNDGIWEWDVPAGTMYFSQRWHQMLGLEDDDEAVSVDRPEDWFSRAHPADSPGLRTALQEYADHGRGMFENEHRLRHGDGTWRWVQACAAAVRDQNGRALRIAGSITDITAGKLTDPLTGLSNRLDVTSRLERLVERSREGAGRRFALMFIDLDRFKLINDSLGHVAGDQLLLSVATRLTYALRSKLGPGGCLGRLGGDEFVVLLDGVAGEEEVLDAAKAVQRAMDPPVLLSGLPAEAARAEGSPIFVRASIGISFGESGETPEEILRNADTAMYHAKAAGRGRYELFDSSMHARALARLELENDLRHALDRGEFELFYQPQVHLSTGKLSGFEALVRWRHPERGLVLPGEFVATAEENGLILPLGRYVLREACRQLSKWRVAFPEAERLTISVNLSRRQFSDPFLPLMVNEALAEAGLPARCLHLEVTESIVADDPEATRRALAEFKRAGIGLEIDDFGTGYSSLGQLHQLPFDTMKVDRSFVRNMNGETGSQKIVHSIISLARSLGISVVAEGIEELDHWRTLDSLGCNYGQGFYFSEPVAAKDAAALVERRLREPWATPAEALTGELAALAPMLQGNLATESSRDDAVLPRG